MSFSSDMFLDRCFPCANKTTHVRKLRKFRRQMEGPIRQFSRFPRFHCTESHAMLKAGLCVVSRFHSRGDSSRSIAKCTKYINPPDDAVPISRPLQGVWIKFARGLSGVFGSRSRVERTIHFVLHSPHRNVESSMGIALASSPPFRVLLSETMSRNNSFRMPSATEATEAENDPVLIAIVQSAPDVRTRWTVDGIQNGNCVKSCTDANNEWTMALSLYGETRTVLPYFFRFAAACRAVIKRALHCEDRCIAITVALF